MIGTRTAALIVCVLLQACGQATDPEEAALPGDPYEAAAEAVGAIAWSPTLERTVADLLVSRPPSELALDAVVDPNRDALAALDAATRAPDWQAPPPGGDRPSRDDWEAAAWLAYGKAMLDDDPWASGLTAARLGRRLGEAEGAGLPDLIIAFGLSEAGYLQAQRLASVSGGPEAPGDAFGALPQDAWQAALRAEARGAEARIAEMAADPLRGLGFSAGEVPEAAREAAPAALFDEAAVQEAAAAAFLASMDRTLTDCREPSALPSLGAPVPGEPNLVGRLFVRDLTAALGQIDERRCLTEAARRATLLAMGLHGASTLPEALPRDPALADPFTGEPFAYDAEARAIWSAGRDRTLSAEPGQGPFDDDDPTWWLDTRPLL